MKNDIQQYIHKQGGIIPATKAILINLKEFTLQGGGILAVIKFIIFWIPIAGPIIIGIWWALYNQKKNKQ